MSTSATATVPGGGPGGAAAAAAAASAGPSAVFHNIMQNSLSNMTISAEASNACGPFASSAAVPSYPLASSANATNAAPGMMYRACRKSQFLQCYSYS